MNRSQLTDGNTAALAVALADSIVTRYRVIGIPNDTTSSAHFVVFEDKTTVARTLAVRDTSGAN